jgi:hypothetical protein
MRETVTEQLAQRWRAIRASRSATLPVAGLDAASAETCLYRARLVPVRRTLHRQRHYSSRCNRSSLQDGGAVETWLDMLRVAQFLSDR